MAPSVNDFHFVFRVAQFSDTANAITIADSVQTSFFVTVNFVQLQTIMASVSFGRPAVAVFIGCRRIPWCG
jgi:hypothetical protein